MTNVDSLHHWQRRLDAAVVVKGLSPMPAGQ